MEIHQASTTSQVMEAVAAEMAGVWASAAKRLRDIRAHEETSVAPVVVPRESGSVRRHRQQGEVLTALMAAGGTLTFDEFVAVCRRCGYQRAAYGQFYRSDGLATMMDGKVTITEKGRTRLAWQEQFLARRGAAPIAGA